MEKSCKKIIAVSFEGLLISTKSSLHKTSMSKIWNTGVKVETNVKRTVKIQQSAPFTPGGRPDSLIFDTIYESEEIEDIGAELCPSLIAVIENPLDKDCQVRINVYYSSSLCSTTTPIIVASTSFTFRDFLRSKKAVYRSIMGSEHCRPAPVALIRLLDELPDIISTPDIACRAEGKEWNPLEQKYVFKREGDEAPCYAEELTAEARLSFQMPLIFLKNFASVLSETIVVWKKRAHLERLRVGNFNSREEAYANGWYEVSIAVRSCHISATQVEVESSVFNDMLEGWTSSSTEPVGGGQGSEEEREREREREVLRPSSYVKVSLEDRDRAFRTAVGRTNTEYNTLEPCFGSNKDSHLVKSRNRNTSEYRINESVEGNCVRLAHVEKDFNFETSSGGDFEIVSSSERTLSSSRPVSVMRPVSLMRPVSITVPRVPKNTAFQVYVPFLEGGTVTFEVEFEDVSTGKGTSVGVCCLSLQDVAEAARTSFDEPDLPQLFSQQPTVIPVRLVNKEPSERWRVQSATLSVAVSVNHHTAGHPTASPPLSPFVPHTKPPDFVNNSMLSSTRNHLTPPPDIFPSPPSPSAAVSSLPSHPNEEEEEMGDLQVSRGITRRPSRRISMLQVPQELGYTTDDSDNEEDSALDVLITPTSSPIHNHRHNVPTQDLPPPPASSAPVSASAAVTSSLSSSVARGRVRSDDSSPAITPVAPIVNMRHEDTSQLITDCYEFMWHLGFKGTDPLLLDTSQSQRETQDPNAKESLLLDRVDVSYSQQFLSDYLSKLQNMFSHLLMLISACEEEVGDGCTFRPSRLKKEIEFQPLPINFHYQVMMVQACTNEDRVKDPATAAGFWVNPPNKNPIIVWDSVTCGSFSAHACSYKKGGLTKLLSDIGTEKDALSIQKAAYAAKIRNRFSDARSKSKGSARTSSSDLEVGGGEGVFAAIGPVADMREAMIKKTENYENNILNTVLRRLYSVSQALSVAVNSFIMKLELVIENYIHSMLLERWMAHGFLIVHECLLSVSGKERAMIEDTWLAIETLKSYQVRLLPSPQDDEYRATNKWLAQNCSSDSKERKTQSSTWWHSICIGRGRGADVYLVGREVQVFVPRNIVEQLPPAVRMVVETEGAIFPFVPVLFSQGIDIMQTIATTWDSNDDIGDFQLHINTKGVERLNAYCESVKPCSSGKPQTTNYHAKEFVPHPLTAQLTQLVRTTGVNEKNVQMLIEVERICSMVGGCRVTFCKSGKDRTGMAITLEQSRLLGEVFGTGTSDHRIIRDANVMRTHGTRIMIAEKNIGRPIYSINRLQVKFLPLFYRPPLAVTENLIKSGDNS